MAAIHFNGEQEFKTRGSHNFRSRPRAGEATVVVRSTPRFLAEFPNLAVFSRKQLVLIFQGQRSISCCSEHLILHSGPCRGLTVSYGFFFASSFSSFDISFSRPSRVTGRHNGDSTTDVSVDGDAAVSAAGGSTDVSSSSLECIWYFDTDDLEEDYVLPLTSPRCLHARLAARFVAGPRCCAERA